MAKTKKAPKAETPKKDAIDALTDKLRTEKKRGAKEATITCGNMAGVYKL